MQLGIIGLTLAGKTTIFNALTGENLPVGEMSGGGRIEITPAIVDVPDSRLDRLGVLFHPRKVIKAKVTYDDIGGLQATTGKKGMPGEIINQLSQVDGFLHVVRAFESSRVPHPSGSVDPGRDLNSMQTDLLLNDMVTVERRLEKLASERQKGGRDRAAIDREIAIFERLSESLEKERPLRTLAYTEEEEKIVSGFGLLTRKPILVVVNVAEGDHTPAKDILGESGAGVQALTLQGKLEMEIAQLPAEEERAFLAEYGIDKPGRERVIQASYDLLGLLSFFTIGDDEVRAWTLRRGATALEAADTIHSDLARGFIRAEVIPWDHLLELGSLSQARKEGKLRIEGKDYHVADGEVIQIRFNV